MSRSRYTFAGEEASERRPMWYDRSAMRVDSARHRESPNAVPTIRKPAHHRMRRMLTAAPGREAVPMAMTHIYSRQRSDGFRAEAGATDPREVYSAFRRAHMRRVRCRVEDVRLAGCDIEASLTPVSSVRHCFLLLLEPPPAPRQGSLEFAPGRGETRATPVRRWTTTTALVCARTFLRLCGTLSMMSMEAKLQCCPRAEGSSGSCKAWRAGPLGA